MNLKVGSSSLPGSVFSMLTRCCARQLLNVASSFLVTGAAHTFDREVRKAVSPIVGLIMREYVFRCGVCLVATLCADCNRADAFQQAACDFLSSNCFWGVVSIALLAFVCELIVRGNTGHSSVGRASNCRRTQQSDAPWCASALPAIWTQGQIAKANLQSKGHTRI